ncbi:hypothetical protein HGRIS_002780 [Hohenbuehelia grisea]|uniref:CCR4-Not complex 3'-5'-exoribonuclease subunit Ccr4 n=1 Tax=Hohenbuehelia grisea TaxID=104357 RepID=A0ABR3JMX1_9AGAR
MYFPQQSKLDQNPWSRQHHPVLGPPQAQPLPPSPGYAIYNGAVNQLQHHQHPHHQHPGLAGPHPPIPHHQHQNSLSQHYPSPPNGHVHHQQLMHGGSPAAVSQPIIPAHWQQQLMKYEMIRSCRSPHHRARQNQLAARPITKSAIPITNPNLPPPETNGAAKESEDAPSEASPALANHPSSTVAPVAQAPRPTAARPPGNNWQSLDMGGIGVKQLPNSSALFQMNFLANLYLNHNSLASIPGEISRLRQLELLDLSGNALNSLPPELGMCTSLKELYVFDNHIATLPPELGTLHQLQCIGVEGNPLDASLKNIVQKDGTPALISFLRDSCPVPAPPPLREWRSVLSDAERAAMDADPYTETFSVLCYNILCQRCATERLYGYTPAWALAWDYRRELILTEITNYDADFLCLQEVEIAQYEDYFLKHLEERDYEGVYWPKSRHRTMSEADRRQVDGCAIFYKASKYQLVEKHLVEFSSVAMQRTDFKKTEDMFNRVLGKDHIAVVCLLEDRRSGTRVIVANMHIHWDPAYSDVKLVQVALLMDEVEKIANNFARYPPRPPQTPASARAVAASPNGDTSRPESAAPDAPEQQPAPPPRPSPVYSDGAKIPLIVCGDFNSEPGSGVYEFLSSGTLPANHSDFMNHSYGRYTTEGLRHRMQLKSAYATPGSGGESMLTNYTPSFQGMLDYVWYGSANLSLTAVLGEVDRGYLEKVVGFPNAHFPSDHVCIVSEFRVKPPREPQQRPPPVFS